MRAPVKSILMVAASLLWPASPALPQGNHHWRGDRIAVYRAGSDDGYRLGMRDGFLDARAGFKYGYRGRDNPRPEGFHAFAPRDRGEYRKGFRDGYRLGYREGYQSRGWGRVHPFHRFR